MPRPYNANLGHTVMLYCNAVCVADARAPVRSMKASLMLTTINISKRQLFECAFTLPIRPARSNKIRSSAATSKRKAAKAQNTVTTAVQMALPIPSVANREDAPTKQIKPVAIRPKPRARRRVNKDLQPSLLLNPPLDPQSNS